MFDVFTSRWWYFDIETYSRVVVIVNETFVLIERNVDIMTLLLNSKLCHYVRKSPPLCPALSRRIPRGQLYSLSEKNANHEDAILQWCNVHMAFDENIPLSLGC